MKHFDFFILDIIISEMLYWILLSVLIMARNSHLRSAYKQMYYVLPIIIMCTFIVHDFYKSILHRDIWAEMLSAIKFSSVLSIATLSYLFLIKNINGFSRKFFILFWLFGWISVTIARTLYKSFLLNTYRGAHKRTHTVFITDKIVTEDILRELKNSDITLSLDAIFSKSNNGGDIAFSLSIMEMEVYRNANAVDEAIIDISNKEMEKKWTQYLISSGIPVHIRIDSELRHLPNASIERLGDMTVITSSQSIAYPGQLFIKRMMDVAGGLIGIIITFIALLIFGPIIKAQSPGPIFYKQVRIGKNGRQFTIYKFRSMYPDADKRKKELMEKNKMDGHMFKIENDPRIIPIGHFMRKHSIDELPQFINVLKGDMTLVGTRPPTLDEWMKYSAHHRARVSAKPGLTGMWQVSGRSDVTNFEDVVAMDLDYIEHWSIWLDIKLLFKTVYVVIFGKGAE